MGHPRGATHLEAEFCDPVKYLPFFWLQTSIHRPNPLPSIYLHGLLIVFFFSSQNIWSTVHLTLKQQTIHQKLWNKVFISIIFLIDVGRSIIMSRQPLHYIWEELSTYNLWMPSVSSLTDTGSSDMLGKVIGIFCHFQQFFFLANIMAIRLIEKSLTGITKW